MHSVLQNVSKKVLWCSFNWSMLQVYKVEGLLIKIELGCLNDAAEKFFATQCDSEEAVRLLLAHPIVDSSNFRWRNC